MKNKTSLSKLPFVFFRLRLPIWLLVILCLVLICLSGVIG